MLANIESAAAPAMPSKPHPQEEKKPVEDHHLKQRQHHDEESKPRQERERLDRTERQRKASQDKDRDREREKEREREREQRDREREKDREEEKMEEEVGEGEESTKDIKATKLLDELFRKTKATPCIYWLPLTDAQVSVLVFQIFEIYKKLMHVHVHVAIQAVF